MVWIGGMTRLTESGLSMTNWQPVNGVIPPLTDGQWQEEFASYKKSPEYKKVNFGMEISEFKKIFWWEYIHRVAGRITGLVFLFPLLFFYFSKAISIVQFGKLASIFLVGGIQALIGWWMVKSGLYDSPKVSHFRLAVHLSFAFVIAAILLWQALCYRFPGVRVDDGAQKYTAFVNMLIIILFIQVIYGAFVAGLDAGLVYNSWPLMDGDIVPAGFLASGFYSLFNDIISIQFVHRWWAFIFLLFAVLFHRKISMDYKGNILPEKIKNPIKRASKVMMYLTLLQLVLGVKTLIFVVPISLASLHQMVALVIFMNLIYIRWLISVK